MIKTILIAIIVLPVFIQPGYAAENNAQECGKQFAISDFSNPKISKLIKKYKQNESPNLDIARELAELGAQVIPYISRLSCERKRHISLRALRYTGHIFYYTYYGPHAVAVIDNIADPAAIPNLKKILTETIPVRISAQNAILRLSNQTPTPTAAVFSVDSIKSIIQKDARSYLVSRNLFQYLKMMKGFSSKEMADVLLFIFNNGKIASFANLETGDNIHNLSDFDIDAWAELVRLLGRTKDDRAAELLNRQYHGLSGALDYWGKETTKSYSAKYAQKLRQIIPVYEEALNTAKTPSIQTNHSNWVLPLNIAVECSPEIPKTLTPQKAYIDVSFDGRPLTDGSNTTWFRVPVDTISRNQGNTYFFKKDITWPAKSPDSLRPIAYIQMDIISGCGAPTTYRLLEAVPQ